MNTEQISSRPIMPHIDQERITVIIACRNEEDTVEKCVREVLRVLPRAEILVVDGGTDRTFEIAEKLKAEYPNIKPVKNVGDRGKGHAIKTGIEHAAGKYIAQFDCDLQFYADDLPAMLKPLLGDMYDLTVGTRFKKGPDRSAYRPMFCRDIGNRFMGLYISILTGKRITDVTTGMKAWTKEAIRQIDFRDDRYSYEAEIIVRAARCRLRMCEIPVRYASREAGASMHSGGFAVFKAGMTIIMKSFAARFL